MKTEAVSAEQVKVPNKTYRTGISFPMKLFKRASKRAFEQKWGFSTYLQFLVERDLGDRK